MEAERLEAERLEAERVRLEAEAAAAAAEEERLRLEAEERERERVRQMELELERKRAKMEEERRKKEEKAQRLAEHKKRRKLESEAKEGGTLAAAKERLAKIQQTAALLKNQSGASSRSTFSGTPNASATTRAAVPQTEPHSPVRNEAADVPQYDISPYRSDHDSDDGEPRNQKTVPHWARKPQLTAQLTAQQYTDPDEIFMQHQKTCSLDAVFAGSSKAGKKGDQSFNRRGSSGNWIQDRISWKEELNYKRAMGYI